MLLNFNFAKVYSLILLLVEFHCIDFNKAFSAAEGKTNDSY